MGVSKVLIDPLSMDGSGFAGGKKGKHGGNEPCGIMGLEVGVGAPRDLPNAIRVLSQSNACHKLSERLRPTKLELLVVGWC